MAKLKIACWNLGNFPFGVVPTETSETQSVNEPKVNSIVAKIKSINADIAVFTSVDRSNELAQDGNKKLWEKEGYTNFVATNRAKSTEANKTGDVGTNGGTAILTKFFVLSSWQIEIRKSSDKWAKLLELPDQNTNVRCADTPILGAILKLPGKQEKLLYLYAVTLADITFDLDDFGKRDGTLVQAERDKAAKYQQAKRNIVMQAILADLRLKGIDPHDQYIVVAGTLNTPFTYTNKGYPEFADEPTIKTLITYKTDESKPAAFFHVVDTANTGASTDQSYKPSPGAYQGADIDYEHVILSEAMRSPAPSWKIETSEYDSEVYNQKKKYGLGAIVKLTASKDDTKAAVIYQRTSFSPETIHAADDFDTTTVPGVTLLKTAGRYELPTETPATKWKPYYPWYRDGQPMKKGYRFTYKNRVYEVKVDISEAEHTKAEDIINKPANQSKVSTVDVAKVKIPSSTRNAVVVTTGVNV